MTYNKGRGKGIEWIKANISYAGDECLIWPFARNTNGYGLVGFNGKVYKAHRFMCAMIHGERPYPEYEARHSCGRGQQGCVTPNHLTWGTRSENGKDKRAHGTTPHRKHRFKLTPEQVAEIRAARGSETLQATAERYGVSIANIHQILSGAIWKTGKREPGGFAVKPYRGGRPRNRPMTEGKGTK
jgi:hypothetical protein